MRPETKYARSGDLHIAYQVVGDGPIDLVYCPGAVSHVEAFWDVPWVSEFFGRLSSFSRLILFDKRGSGLSDPIAGAPTLEERMDDIRAVMDAAGSERAAIFGASEGGTMAVLFAATYPERVSHLVLYAAFARLPGADAPSQQRQAILEQLRDGWGSGITVFLWAPSLIGNAEASEVFSRLERHSASPGAAVAVFGLVYEMDVRDVLPNVKVPTVVLHRTGDNLIPFECARELAASISDAKLVELPGIDHYFFDNWEALAGETEEFITGTRHAADVDRVLSTVLFTDIVGSTDHLASTGDKDWRNLIEKHDSIVNKTVDKHRGRTIKSTGDGVLATFDGPGRGVRCALELKDQVKPLGIDIRAGLHTGEIELRKNDIAGIAVVIAQRIEALGQPGQVLVSRTVVDLTAGSGLGFEEAGSHALKGVPGDWQLFEARS